MIGGEGDRSRSFASPEGGREREAERRSLRRRRARRKALRRRRRAAGLALALVVAAGVAVGGGWVSSGARTSPRAHTPRTSGGVLRRASAHARPARAGAARGSVAREGSARGSAQPAGGHAVHTAPAPGSLPQTHAYPSGSSARFKALMASLWAGIVQDSVKRALPAFFPKGAYVQLKAIAGAGSDWSDRLVHDYSLDIAAAHALLGHDASHARLVRVEVDASYGHWIEPGVCYNSIGYYEMPNARVVYSEAGRTRSLGIASMISWRGVWYVVHLGAVLRSSESGVVDEPAAGPGASVYSGTC